MRWVEAGGHLVVQYGRAAMNRLAPSAPPPAEGAPSPYAPFPASVTPERISDETTPMRLLAPEHPLFTTPNRIGGGDWSGWVQERGIQLLLQKDPRYLELLAATDPFPYNPGEKRGLLVDAKVGKGTWTYVGLVLFRQVPAGVPGAWRLLANLVSRGRQPERAHGPEAERRLLLLLVEDAAVEDRREDLRPEERVVGHRQDVLREHHEVGELARPRSSPSAAPRSCRKRRPASWSAAPPPA